VALGETCKSKTEIQRIMKKTLFLSFTALLATLVFSCTAQNSGEKAIKNLNAQEFNSALKENPQAILLDVRTPGETAEGIIENAVLIDIYGAEFSQQIQELDTNKAVYVYCRSGGRSMKAARELQSIGFDEVYNLDGGITSWRKNGLETTK